VNVDSGNLNQGTTSNDAAGSAVAAAGLKSRPTAPVRGLSFWTASRRVFDLSLGEMLWSRRTIFMALVVGGPVILAIIVRVLEMLGMPALRVNGQRVAGMGVFGVMIWMLFLRFIVPILGVFYGTALMADEVEDKTITYLFTRPVPRGAVLVGKYLAYLVCTSLVVLPSVMLVYFLLVRFAEIPGTFSQLVTDLGLLALGLAVYGALFAFVGAYFKRPLVIGLVFITGWEQTAMALPGYMKRFTVAYYLQALVPHAMPSEGVVTILQGMFRDSPPVTVSLTWLALYVIGFLYLATRIVERREYVLEQ
jgi:ABC-2 type transport system permease protein